MGEYKQAYQHVLKIGDPGVRDILSGKVYLFPKIDGTNSVLWKTDTVNGGSRRRVLATDKDNAGFYNEEACKECYSNFFTAHPDLVIWGEWLCLSGDTEIKLVSGGKRGPYTTLREMYKYSITPTQEISDYTKKDGTKSTRIRPPWWERNGYPQLFSWFEDEDIVKPQKMAKIIYTGDKEVYKVITRKGKEIKSTLDHKFLTNEGWKSLKDISVNDVVAITNLCNHTTHRRYGKGTKDIQRLFSSLKENGKCEICGLDKCLEVHHKDLNWKNNNLENLQVLCKDCHGKKHNNISAAKQEYDYEFDKIESIEYIGIEDCYDISMDAEENSSSFVASGFIVHNCPHTIKNYRKEAWRKFYVFDVGTVDENGIKHYLPYDVYQPWMEEFGIEYLAPLKIITNPTVEDVIFTAENNFYLMEDGYVGEGVVCKNYDFINQFGNTVWAKLVRNSFKEQHYKTMGAPESETSYIEQKIVDKYMDTMLIEKEYAKIVNEKGFWDSKKIPMLFGCVQHAFIEDYIWNILKDFKNPKIDFKLLNNFVIRKTKELKPDLF